MKEKTSIQVETIVQSVNSDEIACMAVSPDGKYLATAGAEFIIKLWNLQSGILIRNFTGLTLRINTVAFSADGMYIIAGEDTGVVKKWVTETGECVYTYSECGMSIAMCITKDNKIVVGSKDGGIKIFFEGQKPISTFKAHDGEIKSLSLSKNEKYLVTGSIDGTAKLWDVSGKKEVLQKTCIITKPNKLDFLFVKIDPADDPAYFITSLLIYADAEKSIERPVQIWDIAATAETKVNKPRFEFTGHKDLIYSLTVSSDGKYLAVGCASIVYVWDVLKSKTTSPFSFVLKAEDKAVVSLCFSEYNNRHRIIATNECFATCWDIEEKKEAITFKQKVEAGTSYASAMTSDGKLLVTGGSNNQINIWDLQSGEILPPLNKKPQETKVLDENFTPADENCLVGYGAVKCLDISFDDSLLAYGSNNGFVAIWNLKTGKYVNGFQAPGEITSLRFDQDAQVLLFGCINGEAGYWAGENENIWWLPQKKKLKKIYEDLDAESFVDISTSTGYMVAAFRNLAGNDLILVDTKNKNKQHAFPYQQGNITALRICKNGKYLITSGLSIALWNIETTGNLEEALIREWFLETDVLESGAIDITADGRFIMCGNIDGVIWVWDSTNEGVEPVAIFKGHESNITSLSFSPDEKYIISSSEDGTTRIWEWQADKHFNFKDTVARELVKLVSIGDADSVAITPSGLFDATPDGMNALHFVLGMEVIELEQLKGRYWRPGLLRILMKFSTATLPDVTKLTQHDFYPDIKSMELDGTLLKVELEEKSGGIGRTSLRINNKEVENDINKERKTSFTFSIDPYDDYFLTNQPNTISIRCWNGEGWLPGPLKSVEYIKKSGTKAASPPALYALFVGTSKYSNPKLSLSFADNDASSFCDAVQLVGQQLFVGQVYTTLLNTEKALGADLSSKENIKKAFEEIAAKASPQDVIVIYFTGHGANYDDGKNPQYYYLTYETLNGDLSDSAVRKRVSISSEELGGWINNIKAFKQVLIFDTCHSGKLLDGLKSKTALDSTSERALDRMKDRTGSFVLTGSAADKVSYEASSYGQSLLTYSLLIGMKGAALDQRTNDQEKTVDILTLFKYSVDEVERICKEFSLEQKPNFRPPLNVQSFDIGLAPYSIREKIKVALPKPTFVYSNLMNADGFLDDLNLSEMLDKHLGGSIAMGRRPAAILLNVPKFPGAHAVRGLYRQNKAGYEVKARVYKDKDSLGDFIVTGTAMEDIIPKLGREVERLTFVNDQYKVLESEQLLLHEKSIGEDMASLQNDADYNGYNPFFIDPEVKITLPVIDAEKEDDVVKLKGTKETELKYQSYSTVQCKSRKFPFFAACNINGEKFIRAGRVGVFVADTRIDKADQWGDELYMYQFDEGKTEKNQRRLYSNFLDRGHMSKREDPQWGTTKEIAERGARLTFFFTNAIPQIGQLNRGLWGSLEDYILKEASAVKRGSKEKDAGISYNINVFTGPVFQDDDPGLEVAVGEKKALVKIPTLFWKIAYYKKLSDGKLYYVGFLLGQKQLLKEYMGSLIKKEAKVTIEEEKELFADFKDKEVFQVNISFIEKLTSLKFFKAIDPFVDKRKGVEIVEKVQVQKKDISGDEVEYDYGVGGISLGLD